ncbi:hypothetical protein LC1Hm_1853 [Halomicrobium sp. LC1Hm]|nr:hypothetical protein LC1Hm_1853 [Halomicrobium sp. LC1Hm]
MTGSQIDWRRSTTPHRSFSSTSPDTAGCRSVARLATTSGELADEQRIGHSGDSVRTAGDTVWKRACYTRRGAIPVQ